MLCVQVLLNLLIALMGSIYEEEQENSANHRRAERASMILEIVRAGIPRCAMLQPCPSHHPYPANRSLRCPTTSVATRTFSRSIYTCFARSSTVRPAQQHVPAVLLADASVRAQTSTRWRRENADVPSGSFLESRATGVVT